MIKDKSVTLSGYPQEKQLLFFNSRAKYIAYGGARGGGKSWALRRKLVLMCLKYPGLSVLLLRKSYGELRENHIRPLLCELSGIAKYCETKKCFEFPSGSRILMGYCDNEQDVTRYQGQEFDVIGFDEATQFTEYQFQTIKASLRGANSYPKRIYLTCNPGGVGHGWVKRLFIDRDYRRGEKEEDFQFIPARIYDNMALLEKDPEYLSRLESLPEELRRAWLLGEWDVFEGQYFSEFREELHTICDFPVPGTWRRYCSIDYGLDMLAALFIAVSPEGDAYVYDEIHESGLIVSAAAKRICDKAAGVSVFLAPGDLWSRQKDSGKSIAELFSEGGVYLTRVNTSRIEGWLCLKEWLCPRGEGEAVNSRLKIFKSCKNLIRCLPQLLCDKDRVGDVSVEPHSITHAPDALRYFVVSRPSPGAVATQTKREKLTEKFGKKRRTRFK